MKHDYSYTAEEISLRPLSSEDSEKYRQLRNREDNRSWFKTDAFITADMQKQWYQKYLLKPSEYMFAIVKNDTKEFLGAVGLYDIDSEKKSAEIGRIIVDRYKAGGKGYASVALEIACSIGEKQLGLQRIYAEIYADNAASLKSFYKTGFEKADTVKDFRGDTIIRVEKKGAF